MKIWPPCRDTIWGTATGRIAGTAVPFVTGQGCLVLFVPAESQTALQIIPCLTSPSHL